MERLNPSQSEDIRVLNTALRALEARTGIKSTVEAREFQVKGRFVIDAVIVLHDGKKKFRYDVEIKDADRLATLNMLKYYFADYNKQWLLAATYISAEMAENCRNLGIQFIDTVGNAYINANGLKVFMSGRKRSLLEAAQTGDRASTVAGMRVVFALLCKPELTTAPYRMIAQASGVSLGTIGPVLKSLHERGHLLKGAPRLADARRLVDEWVINYPHQLRGKLYDADYVDRQFKGNIHSSMIMRRFSAPEGWLDHLMIERYGALLGGEAAAEQLVNYRKPGFLTIYLPTENIAKFIVENRLRADGNGNVEVLRKFWDFAAPTDHRHVAPAILVYADLMASRDPRNHEVAKMIYKLYIAKDYD